MEVAENFPLQWFWYNDKGWLLGINQNRFGDNQLFLHDMYSDILKDCSVANTNCVEVRCGPFLLGPLNMEEDRRRIWVSLISVR